ncbi:hypothetical protein [Allosphingosinicella vermicomposti]|uniref:hypothetical protein n=1 Tax=Allosphingosinicella vermicomposti TaxID=614671 RepID=UPI00131A556C|nr:hypothetical protein [Allosphingosinicella vermicomposti]
MAGTRKGGGLRRGAGRALAGAGRTELVVREDPQAPVQRVRHDGFTAARQKAFLKVLGETGCVRDACRVAGISSTAAYRWQKRLPDFAAAWETALAMASTELEAVAWKRAVEGAEVVTVRNGVVVSTVKKPSDSILRLLMQGANPAKFGRTERQESEKAIEARLRPKIEAEIKRGLKATPAQLTESILSKLAILRKREIAKGNIAGEAGGAGAPEGSGGGL